MTIAQESPLKRLYVALLTERLEVEPDAVDGLFEKAKSSRNWDTMWLPRPPFCQFSNETRRISAR